MNNIDKLREQLREQEVRLIHTGSTIGIGIRADEAIKNIRTLLTCLDAIESAPHNIGCQIDAGYNKCTCFKADIAAAIDKAVEGE